MKKNKKPLKIFPCHNDFFHPYETFIFLTSLSFSKCVSVYNNLNILLNCTKRHSWNSLV